MALLRRALPESLAVGWLALPIILLRQQELQRMLLFLRRLAELLPFPEQLRQGVLSNILMLLFLRLLAEVLPLPEHLRTSPEHLPFQKQQRPHVAVSATAGQGVAPSKTSGPTATAGPISDLTSARSVVRGPGRGPGTGPPFRPGPPLGWKNKHPEWKWRTGWRRVHENTRANGPRDMKEGLRNELWLNFELHMTPLQASAVYKSVSLNFILAMHDEWMAAWLAVNDTLKAATAL